MDHRKLTCEFLQSASQRVQLQKNLMQEFGVTIIYIKVEVDVVANDFIRIHMAHQTPKLEDTTL